MFQVTLYKVLYCFFPLSNLKVKQCRFSTTKNYSKDIKRRAFLWCRLLQTPGKIKSKREIQREEKEEEKVSSSRGICANLW